MRFACANALNRIAFLRLGGEFQAVRLRALTRKLLMDPSKLPKISNTPPPGPENPPVEGPQLTIGFDIWFNLMIGLLLIGLGFSFARFLAAQMTGQPFHTNVTWAQGPHAGQEVAYFDLQGFTAWSDMGVFFFGLILLFEAAAKIIATLHPGPLSRSLLGLAMALTLLTTALNLYVCARLLSVGIIPLISGLAVAFGGWIIAEEWRVLKVLRSRA